ncbi:MAG: flagellar hook-basal body complex protein [Lachnospiraceae bacterium]
MMRSLYSGVAGLKTHQSKMDVIGNNIANVNTVAFKSSSVTFNEIMYQTTQGASGPNALTGTGGINAKQIGLGVSTASIMTNISTAGATQTTGGAFDVKINGDSFFVVSDGTQNLFTRAGSFYVDAAGNLAMTSTGYNVMGWQVDPTTGEIKKDTVSALRIMQASNLTSAPEATVNAICSGVLDTNTNAVNTDDGYVMNLNFYDALGYAYTAKFKVSASDEDSIYNVSLTDILDSNSKTIFGTGQITAGDLFGVADSNTQDTGSLLAGREFCKADDIKSFINVRNNNSVQTDDPAIKIVDVNGNETDDTSGTIKAYYLKNTSNGKMIDSGYFFTDGTKFYAEGPIVYKQDGSGQIDSITYVELGNTQDDLDQYVSPEKIRLRNYFADNYSGIDSNIYYDGMSEWEDQTKYYDTLTINGNTFTTKYPYRIHYDSGADEYIITNDATQEEKARVSDPAALGNYLRDPSYFSTTLTSEEITGLLSSGSLDAKTDEGQYDTYMMGVKGTSYYSQLEFDKGDGTFVGIGNAKEAVLALSNLGPNFENISIDFTQVTNYNNGGSSTMSMDRGAVDGSTGAGKKLGAMTGISIDTNGMIYGSYDNGNTVLLGQIAVATFANASGLQKVGENCYQTTLNSGEFDGIGVDVTADGGSMTTGALEMSNVDLSNEFTDMITTQRGFQANSRIITTSDTLLEELINLKR